MRPRGRKKNTDSERFMTTTSLNASTFNAIATATFSASNSTIMPSSSIAAVSPGLSTASYDTTSFSNLRNNLSKVPKLPDNLASRYESNTAFKHSKIAFDPETMTATNLDTGKVQSYTKSDPIVFILGNEAMPGTFTPAAARLHRYKEADGAEDILLDKKGNAFVICPSHGDIVKVESLQTDHADSASAIQSRQVKMINELNDNPDVAKSFIENFNLGDLFVEVNNKYHGTLYFYERFYNDIENLWNICQACNLHKSNAKTLDWFAANVNFGKAFIEHLQSLDINEKGLTITAGGQGLAEIALAWHHDKFNEINSTTKKFYKEVIFEIKDNLQKAREAIANNDMTKAAAYTAKSELDTYLVSAVARTNYRIHVEGMTPPHSPCSNKSTSDEDTELIVTDANKYRQATEQAKNDNLSKIVSRVAKSKMREKLRAPQQNEGVEAVRSRLDHYTRSEEYHMTEAEKYKVLKEACQKELMEFKSNTETASSSVITSSTSNAVKRKHESSGLEDDIYAPALSRGQIQGDRIPSIHELAHLSSSSDFPEITEVSTSINNDALPSKLRKVELPVKETEIENECASAKSETSLSPRKK